MPLGYKTSFEDFEKIINEKFNGRVKVDKETYHGMNQKCRFFFDNTEKFARPANVLSGNCSFLVNRLKSKYTIDDIKQKIKDAHGDIVTLQEDTYIDSHTVCMFTDVDFGEFKAVPKDVYGPKMVGHRTRGYKKKRPQTCLSRHGRLYCSPVLNYVKGEPLVDFIKNNGSVISLTNALIILNRDGEEFLYDFVINYHNHSKTKSSIEKKFETLFNIKKFDRRVLVGAIFRPDFKLSDNLFVNVDGLYWHSEKQQDKRYHFDMRIAYESEGKRILQFYENEIHLKPDIVKSMVVARNNQITNKIMARKCELKAVSSKDSRLFFESNHLMGYHKAKTLGLYYNDVLVAALSYRINKKKQNVEIARFAPALDTAVQGGFSKLLKPVQTIAKNLGINKIISFCDLRYANGESYEKTGFVKTNVALGWCWTDGFKTYNRLKCKATKDLTEKERATQLKWYKIYDAGQAKYEKLI